jgi:DNA end-binding protein Ku
VPRKSTRRARRPSGRAASAERDSERPLGRGVWSGSISFGLVTIPVELYSATRRVGVSLRMLGPDGTPLVRQFVCPADDRVLDDSEIERGYEVEEGKFVVVEDAELEALAPRRSRDIELTRFVDRDAIDPSYFVRPYFVVPGAEQTKAYRLLAETMEAGGRAALANFVMRGKAYAVAIFAERGLLRAETLRFADEVRSGEGLGISARAKLDAAAVAKMKREIAKLAADEVDERELADDQAAEIIEIARKKLARDEDVVRAPEAPADETSGVEAAEGETGGEVIDLFALIQQRLRSPAKRRAPARSSPKAAAGKAKRTAAARKRPRRR